MAGLDALLTRDRLRTLAGEPSYAKGEQYYADGQVSDLETTRRGFRAIVRGESNYAVEFALPDGTLQAYCSCPHAAEGNFCKHCVAAGLAWLAVHEERPKGSRKSKGYTLDDAERILGAEDPKVLARTVVEWARDDRRLADRLLNFVARYTEADGGVAAVRKALQRALRINGFIPYNAARGWQRKVEDVLKEVEAYLSMGRADAVIELAETGLAGLDKAVGHIDDSGGEIISLQSYMEGIHLRACQLAAPDPVALASRLFDFEMHSNLEIFFGAAERYAPMLKAEGLKAYRALAEAEWEKVPARKPGDDRFEGRAFRITHVMETLAKVSGNVDELAAVMSRDLSIEYKYLRIAEAYREYQRHDQALQWAEEGARAFPENTDSRLLEFLAGEYHRLHRLDDAMRMIWTVFLNRPGLESYRLLQHHAEKAKAWPEWRERALAEIRRIIAKSAEPARFQVRRDHSLLVEVLLDDGDSGAAWSEAHAGGCSNTLWRQLADARTKDHPAEAAPVYMKQAEASLAAVHNARYDEPVALLVKAADAMKRAGRARDFANYLEALREKHKNKRNFTKLLDTSERKLYLE